MLYIFKNIRIHIKYQFYFLDGLMGDEDTDFGELFGQLRAMKEHAMSLPINERKNAAEALVMAFWKAMGGNELDEFS